MENTAEKRLYKKPSSILNAEKARIGRANARQQRKDNPPPPSDDEYSEDEIVYVPTRKTKRKPQESLTVPLPLTKEEPKDDELRKQLAEVKQALDVLKIQQIKKPDPPVEPPRNHHSDIINMAKSRILNF